MDETVDIDRMGLRDMVKTLEKTIRDSDFEKAEMECSILLQNIRNSCRS